MNIAIIPARGGSKRIPGKNIKTFHGKPMIAYSIEAAINSKCFDKIIVSTDDHDIASIAKKYGAEVPFVRPSNISDDHATTMDVMHHAISWCENNGLDVNLVCCLYATAPFVTSEYLNKGMVELKRSDTNFVFSATTFAFPIQRAIKLSSDSRVEMFTSEYENTRSQDLEESFHDAGQFYWGRKQAFLSKKPIFSSHSKAIIIPRVHVQDIDTMEDWIFAEALYSVLHSSVKL